MLEGGVVREHNSAEREIVHWGRSMYRKRMTINRGRQPSDCLTSMNKKMNGQRDVSGNSHADEHHFVMYSD
ncbi:hypothetical protein VTJ04DRAFT_10487 [Mycothermus thermophilus]|uniref:uncharacterized protein n=1 Tax=Humicola insolens TaxID=85995 RepID=UPI00374431E1